MNLALVTCAVPDPRAEGAAYRMWQLLHIMRELRHRVRILPMQHSFQSVPLEVMRERRTYWEADGFELLPEAESLQEHIDHNGHQYDIFWFDSYVAANAALLSIQQKYPRAKCVFDTIDLAHHRYFREAKLTNNKRLLLDAIRVKKIEIEMANAADVTLVVSQQEADILSGIAKSARIACIPNIYDIPQSTAPFEQRNGIALIGPAYFSPNLDAIHWLIDTIWPLVQKINPQLGLSIVGRGTDELTLPDKPSNISLLGHVDDIETLLNQVRLTIAPLRFGAGIKGKVLQSLLHGTPVVGTDIAIEGFANYHNEGVLIANTPEAIASNLCQLHHNQPLWQKLHTTGQSYVRAHYSRDIIKHSIEALLTNQTY
ncbi:glycosyltransferase family 4 protein [Rubellicoccus peritrichatus]|uniref:Glycosyltransferase family 4 protein n=1 Tax=Rubellicoccus peritrichatus TaxID=3080537 RepID=A0AAQ3LBH5_9BACT|nr:glycosyltransferase family 4 protein [Puniceicoccus sp. CR14]WOO42681.1 glycosyltransferase family 4 protein [Puniceicoccus sp. CR14]